MFHWPHRLRWGDFTRLQRLRFLRTCIFFVFRRIWPDRPAMLIIDPANLPTTTLGKNTKPGTGALPQEPSKSTLWRRACGRPPRLDKAAKQQYLTPAEENALHDYMLRMSERGYPLSVKVLRSLALAIARQRSPAFQTHDVGDGVRPPGKNWS